MGFRVSPSVAVPSVLIGAATGLRAQTGLTTVTLGARSTSLPAILRRQLVRRLFVGLGVVEYVGDKLPSTPNRTEPAGLGARIGLGALSGALLARSNRGSAAIVAAGAAAAGAFGGQAARAKLAKRVPPLAAGVIEDAIAIGVSLLAVGIARRATSSD
jgi:uncharacterized membrane protein